MYFKHKTVEIEELSTQTINRKRFYQTPEGKLYPSITTVLQKKKMKGLMEWRQKVGEDVAPIYKKNYWDRIKGDDLPEGLNLSVFDFGVNAGTGRAAKYLQVMIGTVADGGIGPNTLRALDEYVSLHGLNETIEQYQENRQRYYEKLKTFKTFGRGWTRRVNETTQSALKMT